MGQGTQHIGRRRQFLESESKDLFLTNLLTYNLELHEDGGQPEKLSAEYSETAQVFESKQSPASFRVVFLWVSKIFQGSLRYLRLRVRANSKWSFDNLRTLFDVVFETEKTLGGLRTVSRGLQVVSLILEPQIFDYEQTSSGFRTESLVLLVAFSGLLVVFVQSLGNINLLTQCFGILTSLIKVQLTITRNYLQIH